MVPVMEAGLRHGMRVALLGMAASAVLATVKLVARLVAGLMLVAVVGICVKAVDEMITPQQSPDPFTLIVLLAVILVREFLFRVTSRVGAT